MQVFILAVAIAAVLGADPRCLDQNEYGFAVHIAHPMDCRKFYKCDEDHNLSEEICPGNLEYNPVLQVCDYPRGFCRFNYRTSIESALNCDVLPNGAFLPDYSDGCKSFFYCVNGIAKISQCRNGTRFDQDRGYCAPESQVECDSSKVLEFETNKPKDEEDHPTILSRSAHMGSDESHRYPNFQNGCKSFMECNEGDCVEVYCPEGYIFDMIKETCEERENAFCDDIASHPSIEARGPEPSCVVEHGRWYPDNDNCNMFYVCSGGKAYHQKCHDGQYFDRTKRACLKGNCAGPGPGPGGPDDCDSSKDLFLPDDKDCTKFYICIKDKKVHQQCGDNQMYDKNAKYCRKDDKGECIPGGTPGSCDGHPSGSHLPNPDDCTKFFLCIDGKKISQQCNAGQMFDSAKGYCVKDTAGICVPLEPECDKSCDGEPEGTKKVDPYNCADFKLCVDREWRTQSCDGGKYFNPHTLQCVPDDGSCDKVKPPPKPTTPLPELPCDGKPHGTYEPIPADCTKFRLCLSGNWRYLTCDPGYYFNVDELVCKLDDGTCDKVLPPPPTTPCEPVKCKDGALKPHTDCKKYRMCVKGDWIEMECNKGQMFDPVLNHCVKDPFDGTCSPKPTDCDGQLDGSLKDNPNDCTSFFVCVTGTWIHQTCKPDQYFDKTLKYCVPDPHDGTCRPKPTPDPTLCDGIHPHGTTKEKEGDCTGFLVCVLGTWVPQTCDPDKYYNKNLKYCVKDPLDGTCRPPLQKKCDGIYPHGSQKPNTGDCTGFFVCVIGDWIPQTCGADKYYNKKLQYCVKDPLDGTCRPKPTTAPPKDCDGHPHGTFKENTRDCTGYFICVIGTWIEQTCGPDKYYNSALQYCIPDPHDGTCRPPTTTVPECDKTCDGMPEGTRKIQSDNCAGFLLCVDGSWRAQSCDRGHWFNPSKLVCELDLLNQCDQTRPTLPPTKPPLEKSCGTSPHGTFRPDLNDCTSFYLCLYGDWRHLTCDAGYYFDQKLLRCVLNNGECIDALPLPTPTPCHTDCDGYSHGSFKPYENDCHKFYVCVQSKWIPQSCTDGFYFDEVNHYCRKDVHNVCPGTGTPEDCGTHKEGEYVEHADCKKFYICIKGNLLEYNCGDNQYFDKTLKYCKAGTCTSEGDCDGLPDGTTLAHEDKNECDKFYVCFRGKKVLNQCDHGQYFDQTAKYCQQDVSGTCRPTTPTKDCKGIPDGTYLPHEDPNECDKFYVCYRERKVLNQCGTGFYYDKGDQTCHAGSCPPSGGNKCTSQLDGTILVDSSNCAGFIVCYKQQEKQQICGPDRRYDESKGYCVENLGICVPGTPIRTSISKSNCKGKKDGTVFKHTQCNKFYMCKNENVITSDCAESYLFDESLGRCRMNDGSCPEAGIEKICVGKGAILLPHYKCTKFFKCENDKAIEKTCQTNNFFDSKKGVCRLNNGECKDARSFRTSISDSNECTGRPDGVIIPDNDDCSSFYLCIRGKLIKQFCGIGHSFDQNLGICVHDSGSCSLTSKTTTYINTTCVDQEDGKYLANFDACNKFYICINNFAIPQECPDSYMFDQTTFTCVPNDGRCPLANIMKPTDNDLNNVDCEGKHGVFVPDLTNCEQFYTCLYGKPEAFRCSNGQYFDAIKGICRPNNGECAQKSLTTGDKCEGLKDGSIVAHETDCTMFYVCTNGEPKVAICDQGYFFDSIAKECRMDDGTCNGARSRSNAVCYGKHGTLIGHPDCQKYYICLNGQALLSQCLKGYYFDTKAGTCKNDIYGLCEPKNITIYNPSKSVSCIGKTENRFYANIQDNCRSFYSCVKGESQIANCPAGLLYNAILNTCDWPGFVKCVNNKMPRVEEKTCVGAVDGVRYPNIKTGCKSFINCVNGVAHESYCSDGLLFNSKKNVCDWPKSVTCNGYGYQENTFSAIKLYY